MKRNPSLLETCHQAQPLGRLEVVIGDQVSCSVMVLEFVFRSEDVSVWFGSRTLAVMDRLDFVSWLNSGGDYLIDDLAWTEEGTGPALLTIDGHRTHALDEATLALMRNHERI